MNATQPNQFHLPDGCRMPNAFAADFWLARPTENSMTITGRPKMTRNTRYMMTNAAPPYSPVI